MSKISKLVGALVGGLTPASIVGYLTLFGVSVPVDSANAFLSLATLVCGALGVYVAPKNAGTNKVETLPVYVQPVTVTPPAGGEIVPPPSAPGVAAS